ADIFRDLEDVKRQFHHLLKTLSQNALVAYNAADDNLQSVLAQGCWSKTQGFNTKEGLQAAAITSDFSQFDVRNEGETIATIHWPLIGEHNAQNALAVFTLLTRAGFEAKAIAAALESFKGVKRRMEILSEKKGVTIYNDFAHHPTAIKTTLKALRAKVGARRIIAVLQFGSYTMREGVHAPSAFVEALSAADDVIVKSNTQNQVVLAALKAHFGERFLASDAVADIADAIHREAKSGDTVLIMSNSSFDGLYNLL
ncbi:MAG: UDP-N-acetylmuramate:L-alanyl-gamma-D-glutamyl-meso-diaminopimelate ligase, partial [Gammaproteobacteria bacterium CG12_big_fil_rev_8_21_14_0_65_46_12]